jgi:hypothetical protein
MLRCILPEEVRRSNQQAVQNTPVSPSTGCAGFHPETLLPQSAQYLSDAGSRSGSGVIRNHGSRRSDINPPVLSVEPFSMDLFVADAMRVCPKK